MIIILNGPPGVGKDSLADMLIDKSQGMWTKLNFKSHLYADTARHYGVNLVEFISWAQDRETKERPLTVLKGKSPRQALIHVSENIIKPVKGADHYGTVMANTIEYVINNSNRRNFIIADGGFEEEIKPLVNRFEDVYIIRMYSGEHSFAKDSREYLENYPEITFDLETVRGNVEADFSELMLILADLEDIKFCEADYEPDDTPFMTEDYEGDRHYIGEEND
jgi:hypothetical protein